MAISATKTSALPCLQRLDEVQHLHELERFDARRFLEALEIELGDGEESSAHVGMQLDALHEVLRTVEQFTVKTMAIRLTHVLSSEPVPPQLRTLLSTTIVNYADDLGLLRRRFSRSMSPRLLNDLTETAAQVLSLRQILRDGALGLAQKLAQASAEAPWLQKAARDRSLKDAERLQLRLLRVDLRQLVERPQRLEAQRTEARLKALPPPDEEVEVEAPEENKAQRFALLEID